MAVLAATKKLVSEMAKVDAGSAPHVWIADRRLVFGRFPDPSGWFEFASESVMFDDASSPQPKAAQKERVSLLNSAKRVSELHEIETADKVFELASATQALTKGLEIIEELVPGTLDELAKHKKQSKRPVARNLEDLYDVPTQRRFSEQIATGHYVATNNKSPEARGVLRRAAMIAGLSEKEFTVRRKFRF